MPKARIPAPVGKRFHLLVVLQDAPDSYKGKDQVNSRNWTLLCDCGNVVVKSASNVKDGQTQSCGCLLKAKAREHLRGINLRKQEKHMKKGAAE